MNFAALQYLYLLWILPAMVLLAVYSFRKKDQLLRLFADSGLWDRLMPDVRRKRQVARLLMMLAGMSLALSTVVTMAQADPSLTTQQSKSPRG
jgi:hypothetical protein